MSRALAQTLLSDALLSAPTVESALQRQALLGGSLDTVILELGLLGEDQLLGALGRAHNLPTAGRAEIDAIGAHIPRLLPLVFAETYHLVPLKLVDETLSVLVNNIPDAQLTESIFQRLHLRVAPVVTTEVRLHDAMQKLYNAELLPRYTALLGKLDGAAAPAPKAVGEHMLSWGVSSARIEPVRGTSGKLTGQDVRSLVARLDAAEDRDTMVDILLGFSLAIFEFGALFIMQGEAVAGWRGPDAQTTRRLAQISLPLSHPSVFQTIYATQGHYLGPLPPNGVNLRLLQDMGRAPPHAACLAPIRVGGKVVAILYADNGAKPVSPKKVAALLVLVGRAGLGLEKLIHRRKKAAQHLAQNLQAARKEVSAAPAAASTAAETDFSMVDDAPQPKARRAPSQRPAGTSVADSFAGLAFDIDFSDTSVPIAVPSTSATSKATGDASYVAFADVNETPEGSLDEWEDVMVDAVSEVAKANLDDKAAKAAPLSVTWEEVILEARQAQQHQPVVSRPVEMMGTLVQERDLWFDALDSDDPEARRAAIANLLAQGKSIDIEVGKRFPGRLRFDPMTHSGRPPAFQECSGVTELLAARGAEAAPVVMAQLDHDEPRRRFFAIYFLLTVAVPNACEALARRLYDAEPHIRYLAVEALRRYSHEPAYGRIVEGLGERLRLAAPEAHVAAIQVLGQLREAQAVPRIIAVLNSQHPEVVHTAASALAVLTAQTFGNDTPSWHAWWQANGHKPRTDWLLSGLHHQNPTIRRVAVTELQHLTGQTLPFDPEAPAAERQRGIEAWRQWLARATTGVPA